MNIQITQTQCNSCKAIIPAPGQNGATRLAGTQIDFCEECSAKIVSAVAETFTLPAPAPNALKKVRLANGAQVMLPQAAPLPTGATLVT